jgi:hypothetical protein
MIRAPSRCRNAHPGANLRTDSTYDWREIADSRNDDIED